MAHTPPAPGPSVRHSKQIVGFKENASGWDVRESADENSIPPHAKKTPTLPEPTRSLSPVLSPSSRPPPSFRGAVRQPLADMTAVTVLAKEINKLELENARLVRRNVVLEKTVKGLCTLYREF